MAKGRRLPQLEPMQVHPAGGFLLLRDTTPGNCGEILPRVLSGPNQIVESRLDYAGGKKHNVVVKKAGTAAIVVTHVAEVDDDRKLS
jgi:hypothetical protein